MVWIIVFTLNLQPWPWLIRIIKVMGKLHFIILGEIGNSKEGGHYKFMNLHSSTNFM